MLLRLLARVLGRGRAPKPPRSHFGADAEASRRRGARRADYDMQIEIEKARTRRGMGM
ncbi:MAG: hypothetical protein AAF567_14420 [Actinomycetota bacterium]